MKKKKKIQKIKKQNFTKLNALEQQQVRGGYIIIIEDVVL
jgi:hypothetical protein